MNKSRCGLDCNQCELKDTCGGCAATNGRPFGGECVIAVCCQNKGQECCNKCSDSPCNLKNQLIAEFNALDIEDMAEVSDLNALKGSFINLEYTLPNGQAVKLWDDDKIYLGNQICKKDCNRCYGLTADENYLLVCEYGDGGSDAEIIVYKKRR
ncbi:hypothetical protein SDC9_131668 [bioreactor metagenome]|uniref:DUF3795 domain-containing protein n=1 Tax=bioreactor metagenome TaxID=1076179 RepID=A0A645D5V6_9ZZZZ